LYIVVALGKSQVNIAEIHGFDWRGLAAVHSGLWASKPDGTLAVGLRKIEESVCIQFPQYLSASNVLKSAIGLSPANCLAYPDRNRSAALVEVAFHYATSRLQLLACEEPTTCPI
jgi:hypothetical protein